MRGSESGRAFEQEKEADRRGGANQEIALQLQRCAMRISRGRGAVIKQILHYVHINIPGGVYCTSNIKLI